MICLRRHGNIWTPRTCKSWWSATARKSNRRPRSLANSKSSTLRASESAKRIFLSYCFRYLLDALYCGDGIAATLRRNSPLHSCLWSSVFPEFACHQEKTAGAAGQSQYGDFGTVAASAGDRAGDGRQDFTNAQDVRPVQERRRFAGDSRTRREAARKDAQVFDRRETGCAQAHAAAGKVRSSCRKATGQTIREIPRFARNDSRRKRARSQKLCPPRRARNDRRGCSVMNHKVWWLGLGVSMRRGTWSAMRMP